MFLHLFFKGFLDLVALVPKRAILDFFSHGLDFLPPHYPTLCIKKMFLPKESFEFLFIKSKKCHGVSVKNESARAKKTRTHPPPL